MGILGFFVTVLIGLIIVGVVLFELDLVDASLGGRLSHGFQARNNSNSNNNNKTNKVSFALKHTTPRTNTPTNSRVHREERIIYLHHIHKAGGSLLCAAARLNGLKVNWTHNCNVQDDQQCCGNEDTLQAQLDFAKTTKLKFVSNEADLIDHVDSQHYRYVIQLRNSQERYKSHWKNVVRAYNLMSTFSDWWNLQPDNWTVRKICGRKCRDIAKFNISQDLFQYTLQRLHVFDDILLLERFNDSYTRFTKRVGWKSYIPKASINKDSKRSDWYPPLGNDSWDPSMTALDNALYDYAFQLYNGTTTPVVSLDMVNATKQYFQQGPRRGCTTPCCSQECSKYRS